MNAHPDSTSDGIAFEGHPTQPDWIVVTIDGKDTRTITRDGADYIAWIGFQYRTRFLGRALKECAADARHQRDLQSRAEAQHRAYARQIGNLTPEQFEYVLAHRESELAGLSVNSPGRADMLRSEIQAMKGARP